MIDIKYGSELTVGLIIFLLVLLFLITKGAYFIPLWTIKGKRKAMTVYVTVFPVLLTMILIAQFICIMGIDLARELALYVWPIFCLIIPFATLILVGTRCKNYYIIEENGISEHHLLAKSDYYSFEELKGGLQIVKPFGYKGQIWMATEKSVLILDLKICIGGRHFLLDLCEEMDLDYNNLEYQMKHEDKETLALMKVLAKRGLDNIFDNTGYGGGRENE